MDMFIFFTKRSQKFLFDKIISMENINIFLAYAQMIIYIIQSLSLWVGCRW